MVASRWQLVKVRSQLRSAAAPGAAGAGQGQMVRITLLRGLHRSGPGALRLEGRGLPAPGAGQGRRPRSLRAFSHRPLEGCGPWRRRALSMVRHGAAAAPSALRSLPQVARSPTFLLSPRPWLFGRPGPVVSFPFLGFLLLFFRLLLVFLPFPHWPVYPPASLLTLGFQNY